MSLEAAANLTSVIAGQSKPGLQALGANSRFISLADTRKCTRSLDIDVALATTKPHDSRWDYIIEYNNYLYFVEVHPASTSEVERILKKLDWLKEWLLTVPTINTLPKGAIPFRWAVTGKYAILSGSSQARKLAQAGLKVEKPVFLK